MSPARPPTRLAWHHAGAAHGRRAGAGGAEPRDARIPSSNALSIILPQHTRGRPLTSSCLPRSRYHQGLPYVDEEVMMQLPRLLDYALNA